MTAGRSVSVTAAKGFEAGGLASGIKPSGAPDLAMVATVDHRPVTAAGVFTSNLVAAAPVQVSRRHLADGTAAAVVLNSGNANAATGEAGMRDALRMAELTAAGLGCLPARRARVLHRPHRDPDADGPGGVRDPEAHRHAVGRRRRRHAARPTRSSPPTPCARRRCSAPSSRRGVTATDRRDGQGRGDAVARDGDDARGHHHRRRRRRRRAARACSRLRSPTRSTRCSSTARAAPTTPCSCSPTARSATSPISARARGAFEAFT